MVFNRLRLSFNLFLGGAVSSSASTADVVAVTSFSMGSTGISGHSTSLRSESDMIGFVLTLGGPGVFLHRPRRSKSKINKFLFFLILDSGTQGNLFEDISNMLGFLTFLHS